MGARHHVDSSEARRGFVGRQIDATAADVKHSVRSLARQPLFTLSVVSILAVGIGLITSVLSIVNALYWRPWQVSSPDSMAVIRAVPAAGEPFGVITITELRYLREHSKTLANLATWYNTETTIGIDSNEVSVNSEFVTADYFRALNVPVLAGRALLADDETTNAPKRALISEHLLDSRFGGDRSIVGRVLHIRKEPIEIVGVVSGRFRDVFIWGNRTDLWLPLTAGDEGRQRIVAGRLKPGVSRETAAAELTVLSQQFSRDASRPSHQLLAVDTRPFHVVDLPIDAIMDQLRTYFLCLLVGSVVFVLACANAGNLLLARSLSRQREIAIRVSIGASRLRVFRTLLTESILLSLIAGGAGFGLTFLAPRLLLAFGFSIGGPYGFFQVTRTPENLSTSFFEPDLLVLAAALVLACLTTVLSGLLPAWRASGLGHGSIAGDHHGRRILAGRLQPVMLAVQIMLTTLVLASAAVLTRAVDHPERLQPGFAADGVQAITVSLPKGGVKKWKTFLLNVQEEIKKTESGPAALSQYEPFANSPHVMMARRPDEAAGTLHPILMRPVSSNYFAVLRIPLVEGRTLADGGRNEIVVNQSTARMLWPGTSAVGKTVLSAMSQTNFETCTVVGIVKDTPIRSMGAVEPVVYQAPDFVSAILIRDQSPGAVERIRSIVAALDPTVAVSSKPFADYMNQSLTSAKVGSNVGWIVGILGVALAIVGSFGVFAYAVETRRREIGIRLALGARARHVIAAVSQPVARTLMVGVIGGLLLLVAAGPLLRQLLFGVSALDPVAYVETIGIVGAAVSLAAWLPTRRGLRIDPALTLRAD